MNYIKKFQGSDFFERMSLLYQISKLTADKNPVLSAYYGNGIVNIAKKNVLKMHPEVKRQICKKCRCVMVNNVTMRAKTKTSKKRKFIQYTCYVCYNKKNVQLSKTKAWFEKPEAVVEIITNK